MTTKGNTEFIHELDAAIEKLTYTRPYLQSRLQETFFGNTSVGYKLTDDEQQFMTAMQKLDVLCMTSYAPYCSRSKDGKPAGVLVSLLNDFAADNNIEINYDFCDDAAELESRWETGNYDCAIGLPFTPLYCIEHGFIRSSSVLTTNMEIYGKSQSKPYSESSIAVYAAFTDQMNLDSFAEIIQYPSLNDCFEAVASGQADYGCTNQLTADYEIFSKAYPFIVTPLMGEQLNIGVAVSIDMDSRFLSALNGYIDSLPENTVTAYLSEATRHEDIDSFALFVRSQPLTVAMAMAAVCVCVVVIVMLIYEANRRKRWNAELQSANEALRKATAAKSEFLSRMSHDIRTPMNAILGFAELGRHDINSPELLQEDIDKICSSGEFLLGLVNDVLDISKIESNAMVLRPQPYPLAEFKQQLQTLVTPLCSPKQIAFVTRFDANMPECISVDKVRFNQIFFNLLSNAAKFTAENGHIEVSGTCLGVDGGMAHIKLTVKDDGIGMSEEFQQHMFESFTQEERHISTTQGTGLGLSIVKSFVGLIGGTISVKSKPGAGSSFTVDMKVSTCPLPAQKPEAPGAAYEKLLSGKRVLMCEDHPINRQLAVRLLNKVGIEVISAENGDEGVRKFAASPCNFFDAVLMDIRMPVMDGLEATKAIRALDRPDAGGIPIIAMTANAFDDDVQKCIQAGMTAHLSKPLDVKKLYSTLARV